MLRKMMMLHHRYLLSARIKIKARRSGRKSISLSTFSSSSQCQVQGTGIGSKCRDYCYIDATSSETVAVSLTRGSLPLPSVCKQKTLFLNESHRLLQTRKLATKKQKRIAEKEKQRQKSAKSAPNYGTTKTGIIVPNSNARDKVQNEYERAQTNGSSNFTEPLLDNLSPKSLPLVKYRPILSNLSPYHYSNNPASDAPVPSLTAPADPSGVSSANPSDILDLTSMYDPTLHLPDKPDFNSPSAGYEPATELGEELMRYIAVTGGPITVGEFMRRCLRDEKFGYYTNPPKYDDHGGVLSSGLDGGGDGDAENDDDWDDWDKDDDDGDSDVGIDGNDSPPSLSNKNLSFVSGKEGRGHKIIGSRGDFTTAPEISQIFGECLTVWLLTQYEALGKPDKVQLVEIGPGRGTLICDVLRTAANLRGTGEDFFHALKNGKKTGGTGVHLVEVSENLRMTQKEALETLQDSLQNKNNLNCFDFVKWKSKKQQREEMEALVQKVRKNKDGGDMVDSDTLKKMMEETKIQETYEFISPTSHANSIQIQWHDDLNSVPTKIFSPNADNKDEQNARPIPTFIICQEIMDALPVFSFQKTENGWRERMVDVAIKDDSSEFNGNDENSIQVHMRDGTTHTTTRSNTTTYATASDTSDEKLLNKRKKPRFRFVLPPDTTPALRSLLNVNSEGNTVSKELNSVPNGTIIEVCPEAMILAQDITSRIDECTGAALIVDYGNEGSGDTLRAFRRHEQVHVLSSPGMVDVTADVDFEALKNAVNVGMRDIRLRNNAYSSDAMDEENVTMAFGPVTQGRFLASMGAMERTIVLIDDDNTTEEQANDLYTALERLVSPEEMGERYKVMAIAKKKDNIFPPPGF